MSHERTAELTAANEKLKLEIAERKRAEVHSRIVIEPVHVKRAAGAV